MNLIDSSKNHLVRVCLAVQEIARVPLQRNLFTVAQQVIGEVGVRVHLMVVTKEQIKPVLLRHAGGASIAKPPLSESPRSIPALLKHFRDREFIGTKRVAPAISPD